VSVRRLVIRPGAIGDVVCSLPAIEFLAPAEIWAPAAVLPLLRHIAPARSIASAGLDRLEIPGQPIAGVVERLKSFDEIVSWYGAARPEFRAAAGRHGLNIRLLPALPAGPENEEVLHAADFFLRSAGAAPGRLPRLPFQAPPESFAAIHPFSGSPKKNWPVERFRQLAGELNAHLDVQWCAGPEEELDGAARFPDLLSLARWLAQANVYIGNDSGPTHLAAAVGTRTVALFGPTDPAVWAPRGADVSILTFADATPERVASLALA